MKDFYLEKINSNMSKKEFEMFQDIPAKENGSTNLCFGIPFESFPAYIENQMAREFNKISKYDTPTNIYLFYVGSRPVGYVGIRTKINKQWMKWSGNIFYAIRKSDRNKGYGTKLLACVLNESKKLGLKIAYIQSSKGNIASQKVIEKNGCELIRDVGTRYYKKNL